MRGCHSLPRKLVEDRIQAFRDEDFGFIYDSYHADAPFLEQFPDRSDYLAYAAQEIAGACCIERVIFLFEQHQDDKAVIVFQQLLKLPGGYQESFEMARLEKISGLWKYLGSERIDRASFRGRPEDLRPADFERNSQRLFF